MWKTFLIFSAAALLMVPCSQAQSHRSGSFAGRGGSNGHGDYGRHGGRGGRYYFFGGTPYFFPFYDVGFGFPAYDYAFGDGYGYGYGPYGDGPGAPYGDPAYEGRIVNNSASGQGGPGGQAGPSLPAVVQQQLAKRGYYKGAIDGEFGPASRAALSRFQRKNGLEETGRIDEPTLMALGFSDHR
jgi:hypothetical protein